MAKFRVAGISFDHMHMGDLLRMVHEHPEAEIAGTIRLQGADGVPLAVEALDERRGQATLATVCLVGGKAVVEGEATIMVPRRSA